MAGFGSLAVVLRLSRNINTIASSTLTCNAPSLLCQKNLGGQSMDSKQSSPAHPASDAAKSRIFDSREIFGDEKVVEIRHNRETYRLLITRNDKLILQK